MIKSTYSETVYSPPLPPSGSDALTEKMQEIYAPYRVALCKTESNSRSESLQAISQAQQAWNQFAARFGANPPAPYDRDADFANSLAEVNKHYTQAAQYIVKNQLDLAHAHLVQVRDILSALRQRNHVVVYSDHMNAFHAAMQRLVTDGPTMNETPDDLPQLAQQADKLSALAHRLLREAPAEYTSYPEFLSLVQALEDAVSGLKASLLAQHPETIQIAVRKIKHAYSKLFLIFG